MPQRYIPPPTPQYALESGPILLKDGRTATLRPAQPEDRALFVEFLQRLSPQARTFRFFSEVDPETAADLLLRKPPDEDKVTLVVLTGDPERIIATGEYVQEGPGSTSAEVAFLVDDWYQGRGLGSLLLERLALIGVQRGIRRFHAFTLAENKQMLDVFKASGFRVESHAESGEVEVSFDIEPNPEMVARFELRERVATVASLLPVLRPRGVAVVGASRDPSSVGYQILEHLVLNRFQGPVYPVNPAATPAAGEVPVVGSMLAYTSVKAVPGPIDLAIITTPRDKVLEAAEACGQRGVRALMVVTTDMEELQIKALVKTCRHYGMRLLGPGSLALMSTSPEVQLCAGLAPRLPLRGRIAMSSQSGAVGLAVLEYAREMGMGFSNFVSLGAKVDISSNDLIQYWEEDPETGLILLYVESFGNPRRFARLARRVGRKKPILAVRPGRDPVVEALFKQTGVVRAENLEKMFDIAAILAHQPLPEGPRVALLTNASGPADLAKDALEAEGLQAEIRDLGSRASAEEYLAAARELLSGGYHAFIALFVPLGYATLEEVAEALQTAFREARAQGIQIPVLTCFMTAGRPRVRLGSELVPSYRFPESAGRALAAAYAYAQWRTTPPGEIPDHGVQEDAARALIGKVRGQLSPKQTQELLGYFGITLQAASGPGIHMVMRIRHDALFGPVLSLSLTGLPLGEQLLGLRITPLTDREALEMLQPLAGKAHLESLQDLLLRVSRLVEELPEVEGLELALHSQPEATAVTQAQIRLRNHPSKR
ncbi:bifunctional acetate--CoA ligase family protein/GNAT family N-acetyltransferase [Meiothermus taiwanensis]|uniref:bifunctional acetate--CoA ligase family protein/GNAT family N-acetyltransferase n=1 Tax=Meiothermus taiwanensis TaxID=172827 RepID=UPI0005B6E53F|nr:GNAT family N-acetyltransferase [Meiothermus taiwanensis]KIQ54527.1 6-carboxyhexanoate--CoA ligase [Meiothermus taiwanensis]